MSKKEQPTGAQTSTEIIYCWKYSNGMSSSVRVDKKTKCCSDLKYYKNKELRMSAIKSYKEAGAQVFHVKFDVGIMNGISQDRMGRYTNCDAGCLLQGFNDLQILISAYKKDGSKSEILSLVSLILSGYMARIFIDDPKVYFARAPLVVIRKHSKDLCGGFEHLQRIAQSLIVDTSRDSKVTMCNPAVIPSHKREMEIERCAYATLSTDCGELSIPTWYRDTAVLIHSI